MKILLSFKIAFRFFIRKKKDEFFSAFSSSIAAIGIALGISISIVSLSIVNGFKQEIENQFLKNIPHGTIEPICSSFQNWEKSIKKIKKISGITTVDPYLNFLGIIRYLDRIKIVQVNSIDFSKDHTSIGKKDQSNIFKHLKYPFVPRERSIILGEKLANLLNIKIGDQIDLFASKKIGKYPLKWKKLNFQVDNFFSISNQIDGFSVWISLKDAQNLLGRDDIDGIEIRVEKDSLTKELLELAAKKLDFSVHIKSWMKLYRSLYKEMKKTRVIAYLIIFFILLISVFSIVFTSISIIENKQKEIEILRKIGANKKLIRDIFLWYVLLIDVIGTIIGTILGSVISLNLDDLIRKIGKIFNFIAIEKKTHLSFIPSCLSIIDVAYVSTVTMLSVFMIGYFSISRKLWKI